VKADKKRFLPVYAAKVVGPLFLNAGRRVVGRWLWLLSLGFRKYIYTYSPDTQRYRVLYSTWSKKKVMQMFEELYSRTDAEMQRLYAAMDDGEGGHTNE